MNDVFVLRYGNDAVRRARDPFSQSWTNLSQSCHISSVQSYSSWL